MNIDKSLFFKEAQKRVKEDLNKVDQKIINYSLIIDKIPKNINELLEQLRIITDLKFPTMDQLVTIKQYCSICLLEEINDTKLKKIGLEANQAQKVKTIIDSNIGVDYSTEDKQIVDSLANNILELVKFKEELNNTISRLLEENYPNYFKLTNTVIASKMLEISGSFERLSKMPSSTIQLLGSEKSFFKALRLNKKTPKYGIIYTHPMMCNLSNKNKGKFARLLASKISIAVKADLNKNKIYDDLLDKLNKKLKEF